MVVAVTVAIMGEGAEIRMEASREGGEVFELLCLKKRDRARSSPKFFRVSLELIVSCLGISITEGWNFE